MMTNEIASTLYRLVKQPGMAHISLSSFTKHMLHTWRNGLNERERNLRLYHQKR